MTSFLGNCSSCTGTYYLGNPLNCNVIGYHGSPLSWTVEHDFCHRSVVLDHDYHVTIQVYPDWILDDQGNHAWNHSAEGMSSTERAARSWREYRDEKDPLCENWERRNWREKNCLGNVPLKREQRISLPSDALWVYLIGVYVIRLHAVQFGNNWMKKIPRTAKICNFYPLATRRASPSFSYDSPVRNIRQFPPQSHIRGR